MMGQRLYSCAVQCCASKVHQGRCSLAAKNPGTEHSLPFSSLLPSPPAAADDGHNKNSSSDLVQVVAFFLAEAKGFHQDWRVLWIGYTTCPKCESILDMTKAKCGWLSPAGRGIIKSLPTLILFNLISYPEINQNQSNQCTLSLFIALFVPKYGRDPEFQSKKICK